LTKGWQVNQVVRLGELKSRRLEHLSGVGPKLGSISTIIAKPTKNCNADCLYCAAPPDGEHRWSMDDFKFWFEKVSPYLTDQAHIIWHGGEPMLMGPEFFYKAHDFAKSVHPNVKFGMQSNILLYSASLWKDILENLMEGRISTSFDPDEMYRTLKGSTEAYTRRFYEKLELLAEDGFRPLVIGTYSQLTWTFGMKMYEKSLSYGDRAFDLRFNYRYPAGRDMGKGEMLSPETYGVMLIELYDRWINDVPEFQITPLNQMLKKVIGIESASCPWTKSCGGHILGIEPSMDTYNCSEFADLDGGEYRFGNMRTDSMEAMLGSQASLAIRRRRVNLPMDCTTCRHFQLCEGGCTRDAVLYEHGMGGKFHYCRSWMMVFDRIRESVKDGDADAVIIKYGEEPDQTRRFWGV
jgi:radical SAM protein with 4Fe4S-binding SPASM domain